MRSMRTVAALSSACLVLGAFIAVPAEAKKKKKKPKACAAYTPSSWSADLPIELVTDAHTADAPLEIEVEVPAGVGFTSNTSPDDGDGEASHAFTNVQVDSAAATTGIYAQVEYTPIFDYDLFLRDASGVALAFSAGFAPGVPLLDGTGNGGHTDVGSENVDGLEISDCDGLLVDVGGATTPGETVTLRVWLGEIVYTGG